MYIMMEDRSWATTAATLPSIDFSESDHLCLPKYEPIIDAAVSPIPIAMTPLNVVSVTGFPAGSSHNGSDTPIRRCM